MSKCAVPLGSRPPSVAPCLLAEWRLKHEDKKQCRPCLVLILLFKNRHRHPLLPQTQTINTALVKADPLKFTQWGLRQGWGSLQALHKEQELHFNCALHLWTWLSIFSLYTIPFVFSVSTLFCLLGFYQKSAKHFKRPLNETTRGRVTLFHPERIKTVCMSLSRQAMLGNIKTILLFVIMVVPN